MWFIMSFCIFKIWIVAKIIDSHWLYFNLTLSDRTACRERSTAWRHTGDVITILYSFRLSNKKIAKKCYFVITLKHQQQCFIGFKIAECFRSDKTRVFKRFQKRTIFWVHWRSNLRRNKIGRNVSRTASVSLSHIKTRVEHAFILFYIMNY